MATLSAENAFKKGLAALVEDRPLEASQQFRRALDLERERSGSRHDMRYLSYYGLSLARAGLSEQIALQACRTAVARQSKDPVLLLNLGRVYLLAGRRIPALECFEKGVRLAPENKVLRRELAEVDRRRPPVVPFLSRTNPINRWLGKIRASRTKRTPGVGYAGVSPSPH